MILALAKIANLDHLFPVTKQVVLAFPPIYSDLPWWRGGWMLRGQLVHHVPCILGVQTSSVSSWLETIEDWSLQSHKMLLSMKKCLHVAVPLTVWSIFGSARTGTKGRDLQRCLPGTLWIWVEMEASYTQRSDHGVSNVHQLQLSDWQAAEAGKEANSKPKARSRDDLFFWNAVHMGPASDTFLIYFTVFYLPSYVMALVKECQLSLSFRAW